MAAALRALPLINKPGASVSPDTLSGKVIAFYFSAHWCPPCRAFTPVLKAFHASLKSQGAPFEVIFVSRDRSLEEAGQYYVMEHGEWLAVPYSSPARQVLVQHFGVQGIPHLAVCGPGGENLVPPEKASADVAQTRLGADPGRVFQEWTSGVRLQAPAAAAAPSAEPRPQSDYEVILNVYDVSGGAAGELARLLSVPDVDGVWVSGVCVHGLEHLFDPARGMVKGRPGTTRFGKPTRRVTVGVTCKKPDENVVKFSPAMCQTGTAFLEALRSSVALTNVLLRELGVAGPTAYCDAAQVCDLLSRKEAVGVGHVVAARLMDTGEARPDPSAVSGLCFGQGIARAADDALDFLAERREGAAVLADLDLVLTNVVDNPQEKKFRRVRIDNARFRETAQHPAAVAVLRHAGFVYSAAERVLELQEDPEQHGTQEQLSAWRGKVRAAIAVTERLQKVCDGLPRRSRREALPTSAAERVRGCWQDSARNAVLHGSGLRAELRRANGSWCETEVSVLDRDGVYSNSDGSFVAEGKGLVWRYLSPGAFESAVVGGGESGRSLFVGRARVAGQTVPGKCGAHLGDACNVAVRGRELSVRTSGKQWAEVLCSIGPARVRWVRRSASGELPPRAVPGGSIDGQVLYVCRAKHEGGVHPGFTRARDPDGCCIAYGGGAVKVRDHEVLCESDTALECLPEADVCCRPFHSLAPVLAGSTVSAAAVATVPLLPLQAARSERQGKLLVCHDMRGGYTEADSDPQGCADEQYHYRLMRWHLVDIFVYFSHACVTVPPAGWTNAAHTHGVPCLGTLIFEGGQGRQEAAGLLASESAASRGAAALATLAGRCRFDGWLINVEVPLSPPQAQVLVSFTKALRDAMRSVSERSHVIYYDAVIRSGELKYQNTLNQENRTFFDASDGLFTNYWWSADSPREAAALAGDRRRDVYFGVDVHASETQRGSRLTFGGGGFQCWNAVAKIRDAGVSCALFAPAWTWECCDGADRRSSFDARDRRFWDSIERFFPKSCPRPSAVPFVTHFGSGGARSMTVAGRTVSTKGWFNLSTSSMLPKLPLQPFPSGAKEVSARFDDAGGYDCGACLSVSGQVQRGGHCTWQLFACDFRTDGVLHVSMATKGQACYVFMPVSSPDGCHMTVLHPTGSGSAVQGIIHHFACEASTAHGWTRAEWRLDGLPKEGRITAMYVGVGSPIALLRSLADPASAVEGDDAGDDFEVAVGEFAVRGAEKLPLEVSVSDVRRVSDGLQLTLESSAPRRVAHVDVFAGDTWLCRVHSLVAHVRSDDASAGVRLTFRATSVDGEESVAEFTVA